MEGPFRLLLLLALLLPAAAATVMKGPFRLLLLLALLLPAAAATVMEGPQPCEPALLATKVAHLCLTDPPSDSEHCCEAVVAAVDLGSCLCRVAAEPKLVAAGLNATTLLTVYTSCGGLRAHLAAACQGPAPPAAVVFAPPPSPGPRRTQQPPPHEAPPSTTEKPPQQRDGATHSKATSSLAPAAAISPAVPHSAGSSSSQVYVSGAGARYDNKCAARQLADRLVLTCDTSENAPSSICCQIVSTIVEQSCLCLVSEEAQVRESSHMGRQHILFLYNICGGEQHVPPGQCGPIYPHPPPPPPPPSSLVVSHGRVSLSVLLPSLLGGFVGLLGIGYGVYTLVKWAKLHGFFGGEQPRLPARDAAAAAAEARARAAREAARDVQQPVGGAHFAVQELAFSEVFLTEDCA